MRVYAENGMKLRFVFRHFPSAKPVFLFGKDHHRAAFRRFISEARQLGRIGQLFSVTP